MTCQLRVPEHLYRADMGVRGQDQVPRFGQVHRREMFPDPLGKRGAPAHENRDIGAEFQSQGGQPGQPNFPQVRVDLPDGTNVQFGTEYASQGNKLNQDIYEITDDLTLVKGRHTFSLGTHTLPAEARATIATARKLPRLVEYE